MLGQCRRLWLNIKSALIEVLCLLGAIKEVDRLGLQAAETSACESSIWDFRAPPPPPPS